MTVCLLYLIYRRHRRRRRQRQCKLHTRTLQMESSQGMSRKEQLSKKKNSKRVNCQRRLKEKRLCSDCRLSESNCNLCSITLALLSSAETSSSRSQTDLSTYSPPFSWHYSFVFPYTLCRVYLFWYERVGHFEWQVPSFDLKSVTWLHSISSLKPFA